MEIFPSRGITNLEFGLTRSQVEERLGLADKAFVTEMGCTRLQYFKQRIELSFEPENDDRLGWIEVHHPSTQLFGHRLIGLRSREVLAIARQHFSYEPDYDDCLSFDSYIFDNDWLEFIFEFDCLRSINFGVLFSDDGETVLWPD